MKAPMMEEGTAPAGAPVPAIPTGARGTAGKRRGRTASPAGRPMGGLRPRDVRLGSVILVLIVWEFWGRRVNPLFASYPTAIGVQFWDLLRGGVLIAAFVASMKALVTGYALAVAVGIPVGVLMGASRTAEAALGMYVAAGYSTPLVAMIPLFILWLGLGFAVKVAVVFTLAVFPIIINAADGVKSIPKAWIEVGQAFALPRVTIIRKIVLPATVPSIMTGLRLAVGRSVVAMVIAEFFTTISGLGGIILKAGNNFETAKMFVPIIILMGLGMGLMGLVGFFERLVAPWHAEFTGRDRQ